MKSILKFITNIMLFAAFLLQAGATYAGANPDALVKTTAEDVLHIIKTDKAIQAGDKAKIYALAEEKILPNFDFDRVCRMVLGKNWRIATDDQKAGFQKEFRSLLMRTYASALAKYKDQTIKYAPAIYSRDKSVAKVKTKILQNGGPSIAVDYTLKQKGERWKVFDIIIEKVSLVTNYRSQFGGEIRNNGLDSLISKLAAKNKKAGVK